MRWIQRAASETQVTHGARLWLYALASIVALFLVLPTAIVVVMSFSGSQFLEFPPSTWSLRWYSEYFGASKWMLATKTSLIVAALTTLVATSLGTMAAYSISGSQQNIGRVVFTLLLVPIIVPVVLIAVGTFYFFGRLGLNNSIVGLVLAHSALALPIVVIVVTARLRTYDFAQENVARSLGASRAVAFFLITLPQIRASVLTAAILSFLTSFDEVVVSLFVSGGGNATLTKQMFASLRDFIDPTLAAISTLIILVSFFLLFVLRSISGGRPMRGSYFNWFR